MEAMLNGCDSTYGIATQVSGTTQYINLLIVLGDEHSLPSIDPFLSKTFREAANGATFLKKVKKEWNIQINIIPQEMECQLAYLTAVSTIDKPKGALWVGEISTVSRVLDHTYTHPSSGPDQGPVIAFGSDAGTFQLTYAPDATGGTVAADAAKVVNKLEVG
jgi:hypothetical protein